MILTDFQGFLKGAALAAVASLALVAAQPASARDAPQIFADLVDKLMPTVVNITTTQNVPQQGPRMRDMPQLPPGSPLAEVSDEGRALQDQIAATARAHGIALVGPNCMGLISVGEGACLSFGPFNPVPEVSGPRIAVQYPHVGAWAFMATLDDRPAGDLPKLTTGASPAYDLTVYPSQVTEIEIEPWSPDWQ